MSNGLTTNHRISLARAKEMINIYQNSKDRILNSDARGKEILPDHETFGREAIEALIAQPQFQGLRIYYSMDEEQKIHAILVAVDSEGHNPITKNTEARPTENSSSDPDDDEVILEEALRCPPVCPPDDGVDG